MIMVYVINKHGKPLMPCDNARARQLLRQKKAKVVRRDIFTIQLLHGSSGYKQDVTLGVDTGSKFVGLSATTEKQELFSAEMRLRDDVVKLIADRKMLRRDRRNRKTRYRMSRFNNRIASKKEGWLAPSIKQKMQSHINMALTLNKILPLNKIIIEVALFDIEKIKNLNIDSADYQQGEQFGFDNVREYVLYRDGHVCQHCKGKSEDPVLQVHHLESRKVGGNAPNNLITLCKTCHQAYHKGMIELAIKRGESFKDASAMGIMRWALFNEFKKHFENVHMTYGYITKHRRIGLDLPKTHANDAFCIANNLSARRLEKGRIIKCVPRHNRTLHVQNPSKGGERRSMIAPKWLNGTKFTKFDKVKFNKYICFISGSSNGYVYLRNIYWDKVDGCKTKVTRKKIGLIAHHCSSILIV